MSDEVLRALDIRAGATVLDATVGGGGHAVAMMKVIAPGGRLFGIDADDVALETARLALGEWRGSSRLLRGNFREIDELLAAEDVDGFDAILFDLGISTNQLDDGTRGFSIRTDGALDMRIDRRRSRTAREIVNRYDETDLADIIWRYGEERFSRRIARRIVAARSIAPIERTAALAALVHRAVGFSRTRSGIDSATKTFQALRIAVNDELAALEEGLKMAVPRLNAGGRIGVIAFHSLEDRIVKTLFRGYEELGILKSLTKKPTCPSEREVALNARARSARLRVAERV